MYYVVGFHKGSGLTFVRILLIVGREENVNYGALTKQIPWFGYHRLLGSVFNHKEGSDCEHDLNLGPGADIRPPVIGDDVGHSRGGPSAPAGTVGCEVGYQSRAGGKK